MAYKVRIADLAVVDLDQAISYVAKALGQPRAAASLANEFENKMSSICNNPFLYHIDRNISTFIGTPIRHCPVKNCALWFSVNEQERKDAYGYER